MTDKLKL